LTPKTSTRRRFFKVPGADELLVCGEFTWVNDAHSRGLQKLTFSRPLSARGAASTTIRIPIADVGDQCAFGAGGIKLMMEDSCSGVHTSLPATTP